MSQVLHPACPKILNFRNAVQVKSGIQVVRYQIAPYSKRLIYFFTCTRTHLFGILIKTAFWYLQIFSRICYYWVFIIGYHVNFADLGVSVELSMLWPIFLTFLRTKYFSWLYLNLHWLSFCGIFTRCIFSLAWKKQHRKKSLQKYVKECFRIMLETWNSARKYTHISSFRKYTFW